eukprot:scaffold34509_cov148-Skeletonema_menzelii.AAC.3
MISLLETVGIEVVACYLHPSDLFSIGLTSHQLHDTIHQTNILIQLCIQYLPIRLGVGTNYLAELIESHPKNSYRSKRELVAHVLDKLHSSQLLLVETNSVHDSEQRAKKLFIDEDKSSVLCYAAADDHLRRTTTTTTTTTTVECHFQPNATNVSAIAWMDYILNRDACKRYGNDGASNKFIRDWLMLILSSSSTVNRTEINSSNNSSIQIWRWGCKHSNLSGKGISGAGVIMASSMDDSELQLQQLQIELRLTRLY